MKLPPFVYFSTSLRILSLRKGVDFMEKSKVKELLIKMREEKPYLSHKILSYKRAYRMLWGYVKREEERKSENGKWIYENFYLIEESVNDAYGKSMSKKMRCYGEAMVKLMADSDVSDVISAFFETLSEDIDDEEIDSLREVLLAEGIIFTANSLTKGEDVSVGINMIRKLRVFDFTPFFLGYFSYEQYLRRDPAGIYPRLDKESKALYKRKIKEYAKKRRMNFTSAVKSLVLEAEEKKCHIGELLPFRKNKKGWLVLYLAIFSLFLFIAFKIIFSSIPEALGVILFLLSVLPLKECAFLVFVPIVASVERSEILPRLEMTSVDKEHSTLTVITSLLTSAEDVKETFSHLENISLKTQGRGKGDENLYYGILFDLPESKERKTRLDERIIKCAKNEADRLNKIYGSRFVLFTRERVKDEKSGRFIAYERKRGAINELVKMLSGMESALDSYGAILPEIKYVLTLDSDTDIELGALNKMIGTMAHPLNAPVVGERGGVKVVTKGFGVLAPTLATSLESAHTTRFSSIMSGVGGTDSYHSAVFNLSHVLSGKGIFCGKGMFDVKSYKETILDAFPDGIILSHDILEGTRLKTGQLSDINFFDSIPSSVRSYYNRAHRWARGDIQDLRFVTHYVPTLNGKVKNPMTWGDRLIFINNALNLVLPLSQVLGLFLVMWYRLESITLISFILLSLNIIPLAIELTRSLFKGTLKTLFRRFFGDSITAPAQELILAGWRLSSLAFVAYKNTDAVIRALWRMCISRKKLLEWTTAGIEAKRKSSFSSVFIYTFPSFLSGAFMLAFARLSLCRLMGILWCLFPVMSYFLSLENKTHSTSHRYRRLFKKYASDIWRYFDKYVDASTNYLPPDNVSVFPSGEIAARTSPTNIGLYLLSVLAALDFSLISISSAVERLERAIASLEKLPKFKGQLYNWYSIITLEVIGNEYVSTVDSGNFVVSLLTLYEGLAEYEGEDKRIAPLRSRIKKIEEESDFKFLYNAKRDLFALGFFTDKNEQDGIVYDMYMSEARTTDYYAVARGIVKGTHWSALSRPLTATGYAVGALSWSGTAFEFFMPHLFLPVYKNSFSHEALSYAFSEQYRFGVNVGKERIFGISESGYFAFDEALNYQYRAFGVPTLSRSRDSNGERVISPYSTFLMMRENVSICLKNLRALERLGMYGECGFYEAIDLSEKRVGKNPSTVKSFMCHHLGMSMVALANASFQDIFVHRFMSDREMRAVKELLKEAVPADAISYRKRKKPQNLIREPSLMRERAGDESVFRTAPSMGILSGREHTMILFERGVVSEEVKLSSREYLSAIKPVSAFNPSGIFVFGTDKDTLFSPSVSEDVSFNFDPVSAEYKTGMLRATFSLSAKNCATRIRLQMTGREGEVGIYLEPILTGINAYMSHPSYNDLFFRASYDSENEALILSKGEEFHIALMCTAPFTFEVSRLELFGSEEYSLFSLSEAVKKPLSKKLTTSTPLSPCILAKVGYFSKTDTTFVIGYGKSRAEAVWAAKDEKACSFYKSLEKSRELYMGALSAGGINEKINRELYENMLWVFRPEYRWERDRTGKESFGKDSLYSLGISGDLPVFLVKSGIKREELKKLLSYKKLHYIMGARYDLVIEVADLGYSRGGRHEAESAVDALGCRFLSGKRGGIFFADISKAGVAEMLDALASATYPMREKRLPFYRQERYVKRCGPASRNVVFEDEGYTVRPYDLPPEVVYSHVIATPTFGTMPTHRSLGFTWVYNSRLSRLTYFENDPVGGSGSEKLILSDGASDRDLCLSSVAVHFSLGRAEYAGDNFNVKVAIHPKLLFKAVSVRVESDSFSLLYKMIPVMDDFPKATTVISYSSEGKNLCLFKNLFSDSLKGNGYIFAPFENKLQIHDRGVKVNCTKPGEVVFVLGYSGSNRHLEEVKKYFSSHTFSSLWQESEDFFTEKIKNASFKNSLGVKLSEFWLPYQVLACRFYARSGPYQSGGAWGYRDQAQDCLAVMDMDPVAVRNHIFRLAAHQFSEGDAEHWWHHGRGIRTRCSDDYLWLVWLTCLYIKRTEDKSILGIKIRYLEDKPLSPKEKDRYKTHSKSEDRESLSEHLKRALDLLVTRGLGGHSLPFIGDGDWNDGLNSLPEGSESVWLGFFVRIVIGMYLEVIEDSENYRAYSEKVRKGIEENAFFSDRYARAFLPDGRVLGVEGCTSMKIDALPQAFASISHSILGDGNPKRIALALDSAWRELYDGEVGIFKLFTPPFKAYDRDVGYLTSYPEGMRENGGQYTHGAVWSAIGFFVAPEKKEENQKRAVTLAKQLDPMGKGKEYKAEPYVMAGDVYSNPDNAGRCGWSWYTGAASWYRKLLWLIDNEKRNNCDPFS